MIMVYDYLLIYVLGLRFFRNLEYQYAANSPEVNWQDLPYFVKNINIKERGLICV